MTIIIFIIVLGVLVFVHELGHFLAAKKAGCNVEEFSIGFPPRIWKKKRGETTYTIGALPLGGYVKIKGENGGETDDPRSFVNKSFAWRSFIISAGVLMNVLLGYLLITAGLIIGVPTLVDDEQKISKYATVSNRKLQIIQVIEDSPAQEVKLQIGDVIVSAEAIEIETTQQLSSVLNSESKNSFDLIIERGETSFQTSITPVELTEIEKKGIGVGLAETGTVSYPWYVAPIIGVQKTIHILWLIVSAFFTLLQQLFSSGSIEADVAGPVGIAVMTGEVAKQGFIQLLQFTALLSLNLAVINILPFPALDGGRFAMILIEKIRRKKLNIKIESYIHATGFIVLLLLITLVTAKDIYTYGGDFIRSILGKF